MVLCCNYVMAFNVSITYPNLPEFDETKARGVKRQLEEFLQSSHPGVPIAVNVVYSDLDDVPAKTKKRCIQYLGGYNKEVKEEVKDVEDLPAVEAPDVDMEPAVIEAIPVPGPAAVPAAAEEEKAGRKKKVKKDVVIEMAKEFQYIDGKRVRHAFYLGKDEGDDQTIWMTDEPDPSQPLEKPIETVQDAFEALKQGYVNDTLTFLRAHANKNLRHENPKAEGTTCTAAKITNMRQRVKKDKVYSRYFQQEWDLEYQNADETTQAHLREFMKLSLQDQCSKQSLFIAKPRTELYNVAARTIIKRLPLLPLFMKRFRPSEEETNELVEKMQRQSDERASYCVGNGDEVLTQMVSWLKSNDLRLVACALAFLTGRRQTELYLMEVKLLPEGDRFRGTHLEVRGIIKTKGAVDTNFHTIPVLHNATEVYRAWKRLQLTHKNRRGVKWADMAEKQSKGLSSTLNDAFRRNNREFEVMTIDDYEADEEDRERIISEVDEAKKEALNEAYEEKSKQRKKTPNFRELRSFYMAFTEELFKFRVTPVVFRQSIMVHAVRETSQHYDVNQVFGLSNRKRYRYYK